MGSREVERQSVPKRSMIPKREWGYMEDEFALSYYNSQMGIIVYDVLAHWGCNYLNIKELKPHCSHSLYCEGLAEQLTCWMIYNGFNTVMLVPDDGGMEMEMMVEV